MKTKSKIMIVLAAVLGIIVVGATMYWFSFSSEQRNMILFGMISAPSYENYQEYQVIELNKTALAPSSLEPVIAETTDDDYNSNITVISRMVKNENSKMLKKVVVQPNGVDDYLGWQLIANEGFDEENPVFGLSPLGYLTTGVATNLHTQMLRAAKVLNVELDSVKVEVLNKFHWENMMSPKGVGFLDETHTNIIIKSSESDETIRNLKKMALNSWTAGEALGNATTIRPALIVNGEHWDKYQTTPGRTLSAESNVDGQIVSRTIDGPKKSEYLEQADEGMEEKTLESASNLVFEILAISESADNPERPYLKKVTVSFNSPNSEAWEIYSDELNGTDGRPQAPTSLEYLTAGTAACLTSQITLVIAMLDLDYSDVRVEQQIDYREEAVNSVAMAGYADTVHTNVMIKSDESEARLKRFYQQSLSMCFAGEAFKGATDMVTHSYLNGRELK